MSFSSFFKRAVPAVLSLCALVFVSAAPAEAGVVAQVSKSSQRMRVYVNGVLAHDWPISTARQGYVTPSGSYRVGHMARMHYSKKYHNSPMPYSMFFRGGYAIHGTYAVGHLGRQASHGCIRLAPGNAAALYALTRAYGTQVVIR
ncbi:L,D-transpeptidase [Methylobacterium haplocladii]|uniref:L,D-transpeptidase n=1 Tax=Methylobacterium haplocladii TaxID=1176176 RepID=A0A512IMZ5_9HYPH|nr:L,D-transpeptidase [Methylobacterium haplocladii]GEO99077.1 L,D-transpeptidase [Methylobacterium haplocladii]GJD84078.1 hypothetical protein HPGCJGGD_1953 [Methylobacterium haplocladii]GLS60068.1 L,D-transpeptidase [Methylobacterium haplocladii]